MRIITKAAVTVGAAGVLAAALAGTTALADPPSGVTPAHTDIVGVGSDTTQLVLDQLSTDYNSSHTGSKLYSYDATGSTTITPKTGCAAITRPNGSGAGITALKSNARPSGDASDYCIDFARSSRTTQAGDGTGLDFIRYAQDAVTWSATNTTAKPTHAPTSLSDQELKAIYSCNSSLLPTQEDLHGSNPVTWDEVGGTGTNAVVPVLPQSSSGTRSFFLSAIGSPTLGSCVKGATDNSVEENEGTNAIFSGTSSQDLVFPYSVAVYLAQSVHNHGAGTQGNQVLKSGETANTTTGKGTAIAPTTGTGSSTKINTGLGAVSLTRFVYNVVRDNGTSTHVPTALQGVFGKGDSSGWLCSNSTAQADIASYGFNTLSSGCGTITASVS